jgi:RNA polymerase sigma factor (sigma-70 family)
MDNEERDKLLAQDNTYFEVDKPLEGEFKNDIPKPKTQAQNFTYFHENQESLAELLKQKDVTVIAQLYDIYGATLYGTALRIVISKEIAEQVIQDTFIKVWHNSTSYDASKGRIYTWLLNIARNTAIDATRTSHFMSSKNTNNIDNLTSFSNGECLNPDIIGLREMVKALDEKYTVLIDLIYFNQYTHIEAAEAMDLPLGTVKTRLRYALLELRKAFAL